jgi:ATP-dependent DNA helicase RecG
MEALKIVYENYDIENVHEVITDIIPKGYNASSLMVPLSDVSKYPDKTVVTLFGYIDKFETKKMGAKLTRISAKLYKDGHSISLFWISSNQKYRKVLFSLEQQTPKETLMQVTGKISSFTTGAGFRIMQIEQPKLNAVGGDLEITEQRSEGVIVPEPLYVLRKGTTIFQIKHAFREIVKKLETLKDKYFIPSDIEKALSLKPLDISLKYMHGFIPIKVDKFEEFVQYPEFNKRISLEKIWRILLKSSLSYDEKAIPSIKILNSDIERLKEISFRLSFDLTDDQRSAIWGLLKLFSEKTGTKSLVYGDVGSGKTMVAMFVADILKQKGSQVAILTPTSILSTQHYEEMKEILNEKNIFLVHSKTKQKEKNEINKILASGEPAIVVGTTSLNSLQFTNLKAIFIDEEQKLGVGAKEKLYNQFNEEPHVIYMTATPIPRTLAASIFTNFHIFQIKTMPANRKERITNVFTFEKTKSAELFEVEERMANGEQTLVIVPSIDSNDMVNVSGTVKKYKKYFPKAKIEFIHGRMKKDEVEVIIEDYMAGKFDILIATVMVDSGFSNKNISHVFIENADRFGISQLHQIRGRCGRGDKQGYCYLVPGGKSLKDTTRKRLNYLTETENGFKLSEKDIELRGSGDLAGEKQSGTDLNFIDWVKEIDLMKEYIKENFDSFRS